ncbi:MAG TPA: AAA family ATPase, partial [Rhodothermales bacterium]
MAQFDLSLINERIARESAFVDDLLAEVGRVVVGQQYMVERLLIGLLGGGHVLLEGVPGLAKTLTVSSLAGAIGTRFQRIQFTPDLLPADLLGTLVYNQKEGNFFIKKGPIFSNIILADEINRSPAKVQSALLESMQERQVTIGETTFPLEEPFLVLATQNPIEQEGTYPLPKPFFVLATQNPIEQAGTYPLPEAQLDRFLMKIVVGYPEEAAEREILTQYAEGFRSDDLETYGIENPLPADTLARHRDAVQRVHVDERIRHYITDIVRATRASPSFALGASPRAGVALYLAARAEAHLAGRDFVIPD